MLSICCYGGMMEFFFLVMFLSETKYMNVEMPKKVPRQKKYEKLTAAKICSWLFIRFIPT